MACVKYFGFILCGQVSVLTESSMTQCSVAPIIDQLGLKRYQKKPSADSCFLKSSLVSRDLCFYFKKRPLYAGGSV